MANRSRRAARFIAMSATVKPKTVLPQAHRQSPSKSCLPHCAVRPWPAQHAHCLRWILIQHFRLSALLLPGLPNSGSQDSIEEPSQLERVF